MRSRPWGPRGRREDWCFVSRARLIFGTTLILGLVFWTHTSVAANERDPNYTLASHLIAAGNMNDELANLLYMCTGSNLVSPQRRRGEYFGQW